MEQLREDVASAEVAEALEDRAHADGQFVRPASSADHDLSKAAAQVAQADALQSAAQVVRKALGSRAQSSEEDRQIVANSEQSAAVRAQSQQFSAVSLSEQVPQQASLAGEATKKSLAAVATEKAAYQRKATIVAATEQASNYREATGTAAKHTAEQVPLNWPSSTAYAKMDYLSAVGIRSACCSERSNDEAEADSRKAHC
jgi:hypothetical protein